MLEEIRNQAASAARELIDAAHLKEGDLIIVGCSSSEIAAHQIGTFSSKDIGQAVFSAIYGELKTKGIDLAAANT